MNRISFVEGFMARAEPHPVFRRKKIDE